MNKRLNLSFGAICAFTILLSAFSPSKANASATYVNICGVNIPWNSDSYFSIGNSGSVNNGNDSDATIKRRAKIGNFNKIHASQGIKIFFTQGKNPGYADVMTTPSAKDYIQVYVKDGCLYAKYDGDFKRINGPSIIRVSATTLNDIDLSSAASVVVENQIVQKSKLEIELSSAAKVKISKLECTELEIDLSSSASVLADEVKANSTSIDVSSAASASLGSLRSTRVEIEATSAAKTNIKELYADNLSLETSSAGNIKVEAGECKNVSADASSGAKISLRGSFTTVKKETSSGSSIIINGYTYNRSNKHLEREKAIIHNNKVREQARAQAKLAREQAKLAREQAKEARRLAREARESAKREMKKQQTIKNSSNNSDSSKGVYLRNPNA